jgi:hypothetical protein
LGIMPDTGKALIIEILAGHIPNVSITY